MRKKYATDRYLITPLYILPSLLRQAGWVLVTMDERYRAAGERTPDAVRIADAAERDEVILCEDLAIARNEIEAETVFRCDARVFGVANANITGPDIAARFLAYEEQIVRMAMRAHGPFVVSISARGLRRVPVEPRLPVARR